MSVSSFIKRAWPKLIVATEDPLAPIRLNDTYTQVNRLGKMLSNQTTAIDSEKIAEKFLSSWSYAELEQLSNEPEFIVALCSLLCESIRGYVIKVTEGGKK